MTTTRPYEVVVWGATGTVGKLVCEHVAQNYQVATPAANHTGFDSITIVFRLRDAVDLPT